MTSNLISIVLPIYNGEKYMRQSIDSIINQTYKNWELIIVDDCSTDSTATIANEYVKRDNRIRYYKNEINMRLPKTLNRGFSIAKGKYLTWTSDDNLFKPNALEEMYNALKDNENTHFVYASCEIIDDKGNILDYMYASKMGKKQIIGFNIVGACFMYTRQVYETIGDYDIDCFLVEDYDYWLRIFANFKTTYIKEILYSYRWHDGALTSTEKKEKINSVCETVILKNRDLFGKLDLLTKYYLYSGLHKCRQSMLEDKNKYKKKYIFYNCYYIVFHKIPYKINEYGVNGVVKRVIGKVLGKEIV